MHKPPEHSLREQDAVQQVWHAEATVEREGFGDSEREPELGRPRSRHVRRPSGRTTGRLALSEPIVQKPLRQCRLRQQGILSALRRAQARAALGATACAGRHAWCPAICWGWRRATAATGRLALPERILQEPHRQRRLWQQGLLPSVRRVQARSASGASARAGRHAHRHASPGARGDAFRRGRRWAATSAGRLALSEPFVQEPHGQCRLRQQGLLPSLRRIQAGAAAGAAAFAGFHVPHHGRRRALRHAAHGGLATQTGVPRRIRRGHAAAARKPWRQWWTARRLALPESVVQEPHGKLGVCE
mmetsp:Transcript_118851/g.341268  ORF Transcript_118851/g.341268 Transcript_118851/m.341268 type:complete len:303 (+) Transcript_118851:237-1145(+)